MEFKIGKWRFEELEKVINRLELIADGMSVIQVEFDENNEPHLKYLDGAVYHIGLPGDIEIELKKKIKEKYPNGFHSRIEMSLEWLKERLKTISQKEGFEIIDEPTAYGGMMIDGRTGDAYKAKVKIGEKESEILIYTQKYDEELIIFRKYFSPQDCAAFPDDVGMIFIHGETVDVEEQNKETIHLNHYTWAKKYSFYNNGYLKRDQTALRNDKDGIWFIGPMGKYLVLTGSLYNI